MPTAWFSYTLMITHDTEDDAVDSNLEINKVKRVLCFSDDKNYNLGSTWNMHRTLIFSLDSFFPQICMIGINIRDKDTNIISKLFLSYYSIHYINKNQFHGLYIDLKLINT